MKKVIVGVTLALAVVTSNAAADGIDRRYPPTIAAPGAYAPPPLTWSGFYVGAGIGGGAMIHDVSVRDDVGSLLHFDGVGGDGVFGTAIVGWDWQVSPASVFGVFVDYDFSNISTDLSVLDGAIRAGIDHDHSWSVGARFGLLSSPSTLWYVTGGYTEARFDRFASIDGVGSISDDRTASGWFAGGGIDTRLAASNWFLRLEYRFAQFDNDRIFIDDATSIETEPTMHTARLTLAYKFNSGGYGWAPSAWRWGQ